MASMQIRDLDLERDLAGVVALVAATSPPFPITEASWRQRHEAVPERARQRFFVAEADGRIVGRGTTGLDFMTSDGKARISLAVLEPYRGRGIGSALHEAILDHVATLDANRVVADFMENPAGVRFAQARGYRETRAEALSILDPRSVTDEPAPDVDLRPITEVDPRVVHMLDETTTRDIPLDGTVDEIPYDEWWEHVFGNPMLKPEGSFAAFVDGHPAALSLLTADPDGRGSNFHTGTLREFRGRGLALAVKLATTRWAAANGIASIVTTNDERNAGMLAINRRLGYRFLGRRVDYTRS